MKLIAAIASLWLIAPFAAALQANASDQFDDELEVARQQIAVEILESWFPSPYGFRTGINFAVHNEYGPRRRISNAATGEFRYDELIRICPEPDDCEWQLRSRWLDDAANELNRLSVEYLASADVAEWVQNGNRPTLAGHDGSVISAMPSMVREFDMQLRLTIQHSTYIESSCPSLAQWQRRWDRFREEPMVEQEYEQFSENSTSEAGSYVEMVIPERNVGRLRVNTSMVASTIDEAEQVWRAVVGDLSECEPRGPSR